jgi:uncharacterized protein
MRLSRYVLTYREVCPGEHVLYDVVSDRYVGVDDAGLTAINRWRESEPASTEREAAAALAGMGFLVSGEAEDEGRLAAAEKAAARGRPGVAYVTLMPTLACDLACDYCFQKDHPAQGHMKAEVEAAALRWIERAVPASGAERLALVYIGGEPLTRKDYVLRTAGRLAAAMRAQRVAFEWQIITNGVALDVPFARAMAALGPGNIKVTLDGDQETHDAVRVYRDGRGTFERIFAALAAVARACPDIRLRVGGNFRAGQERSYEALLERIASEGLADRIDSVRFKPVIESGGCNAVCGSHAAETLVQLGSAAERSGIRIQGAARGVEDVAPCELHWDNAWTIDPAGRLYKCLAVAGKPELAIGDVRDGVVRSDPLIAGRPWQKGCSDDCPFVPICLGGCMGGSVATGGRIGQVACDRESLELRFRESIVRRYLDEFHPDEPTEVSKPEVSNPEATSPEATNPEVNAAA